VSHVALRRVVIRLLHDATLVEQLGRDPDQALRGVHLTPDERRALLAVPPAGWRTDPDRAARALRALHDELPATFALAGPAATAVLASPEFHSAIQDRGSLALACGAFLERTGTPLVREIARLETAIAQVRRAPRRAQPSPAGTLRLTPRAAVVVGRIGAVASLQAVREGRPPEDLLEHGHEAHLVVRAAEGLAVTLEHLDEGILTMLQAAQLPCGRHALVRAAAELGATLDEAEAALRSLQEDGLLV